MLFTQPGGHTINVEADGPRGTYFIRVPNDLLLVFADYLGLRDIDALVRTCQAVNRILTPYIYCRAKHLRIRGGRPFFLLAVDASNMTAVRRFIEVGASVNIRDTMKDLRPTSLHSCVARSDIAMAQLMIENGASLNADNLYGITPLHLAVCT
jgi:hypothetical protein